MPPTSDGEHNHIVAKDPDIPSRGNLAWFLRAIAITVILLLALVQAPRAHADESHQGDEAAWIPTADQIVQPTAAWNEFCVRMAAECAVDPSETERIQLTDQVWKTIITVNKHVNTMVSPREDISHWGVIDRWDYPADGYGDCEDYQLLKRRILVDAGLSRRALRMVVVLDENREGHAVLMARTDRGDFILDNNRNEVLLWYRTGYVYIKSEGNKSLDWVSLGGHVLVTSSTGQ
ncbi:transglutaminase-like cysteine peptidase (plasmid) [Microvirga sp. VF16]|nr:transglutaminase-like cysteine peptidase [Microvirga sp. VF16]